MHERLFEDVIEMLIASYLLTSCDIECRVAICAGLALNVIVAANDRESLEDGEDSECDKEIGRDRLAHIYNGTLAW